MLNQIYIHYINTLFVLESFIISCWLLKGKKIGIGIGQFARKKSVSESATKNHDRCITTFYIRRANCATCESGRVVQSSHSDGFITDNQICALATCLHKICWNQL